MADETLILKGHGNVDVQVGGPGNNWKYLSACATMSGPTVPRGGTEIRWCQDENKAGAFRISTKIRTAPDQVTADLMTKLGKIDYLLDLNCPFSLRARFADCGERFDPSNYNPIMLSYCDTDLQEHSYDDLVIGDPGNEDEILVTAPWAASYELRIKQLLAGRIGTLAQLGDQPLNDVVICDSESCGGACGARSDGCSTFYAVSDSDDTPYAAPNIIKGVKNLTTGAWTITNNPILGINGNVDAVECAGSRIIVSSNADGVIAYNDNDTDQDEWNLVTIANAPSANRYALYARTAREIWLAANSGFVYRSVDGGETWTALHEAELTAENLNAVYAYDADLVYAAGDNGVMIKSTNGGESWTDITEVTTTTSNLRRIVVPNGRPLEVYIGTNNGLIFRSTDEGVTFSAEAFDGDGVGTIDALEFCGPCGSDVLWVLHNDSGPRGRILRDFSGGALGPDIEIVAGYTDVIAAGIQINALDCCSGNEVIAVGENNGGYPVVVQVK